MTQKVPIDFLFEGSIPTRADLVVAAQFPRASRKTIARLFSDGVVAIEGKKAKKGDSVPPGSRVTLSALPLSENEKRPVANPTLVVPVLFEDESIIAVNKPANCHCHPIEPGENGTVANFLAAHFPVCLPSSDDPREGGLVHRLDKDTTGVLIAAKSQSVWRRFRDCFRDGVIQKQYLALVSGKVGSNSVEKPILQKGSRAITDDAGLPASTSWEPFEHLPAHTLLRCSSRTGRRHQIRLHLAEKGHPIAGDHLYGGEELKHAATHGQFLHAESMSFPHPITGTTTKIDAPLSEQQNELLEKLRRS